MSRVWPDDFTPDEQEQRVKISALAKLLREERRANRPATRRLSDRRRLS